MAGYRSRGRHSLDQQVTQHGRHCSNQDGQQRADHQIDEALIGILKLLPSRELGIQHVFVGKRGTPMTKKWAEHFWKEPLKKTGIQAPEILRDPAHFYHRDGAEQRQNDLIGDRRLLRHSACQ